MDQIADKTGDDLVRLAKLHEFPEFVKSASMDQTLTPQNLAVTVYADPVNKLYPCHTAASTWLSSLYFGEKKAAYASEESARVQERLDHYSQYWRISGDVNQMQERSEALHKEAAAELPDDAYAWVWRDEDGNKDRKLPLRNAVEVKRACEWLHSYRDDIPFRDRNVVANKILEKAGEFGASVGEHGEFLEKQAGRGVCNPAEVVGMLKGRSTLAQNPEQKTQILKLAETISSSPREALQPDMLVKLADTVDSIDRGLGIVRNYSNAVPRPEDVIFKATFTKAAAEVHQHCSMTSGTVYDKNSLSKLGLDDLRSVFGDDFANEVGKGFDIDVEKLAEVAHTLPRPDAELFDNLCRECGISPALTKGASSAIGMSDEELSTLAGAY